MTQRRSRADSLARVWSIVARALIVRRGQTVILVLMAMLAGAAVAAAPWYAAAARYDIAVDSVARAPAEDRAIVVSRRTAPGDPVPDDPGGEARRIFDPDGFRGTTGAQVQADLRPAGSPPDSDGDRISLTDREDVCAYLAITGDCPGDGEVLVPFDLAQSVGVAVGDEVVLEQGDDVAGGFQVAGTYQIADPDDAYWAGFGDLPGELSSGNRAVVFGTLGSVTRFERVTYTYELAVEPATVGALGHEEFLSLIERGGDDLQAQGYAVGMVGLLDLLERIPVDQRNAEIGIGIGVAALVLLTWFSLVVVLRGAVTQLREDIGWWRLHGAPPARGVLLALGQSAAPLVVGAAAGGLAGAALGRAYGGVVPLAAANRLAFQLTLLLVGVVVAGGLVAVVVTQARTLRTPVRDLLRRVPARGRRWHRSVVDLLVIVVAAAAVGQALVVGREAEGVALLAPPLAVLAISLVAAWAVPPLVASVAGQALHQGRLAVALVAASMARGTGAHRLFALVAVAVALVTTGLIGWQADSRTQQQRAALETGADRVLTMDAPSAAELLAAVRTVDPEGTEAMAVVRRPGRAGNPALLAVDASRLSVVTGWRPEYGGSSDAVAAALRPAAPDPVVITGGELVVEAAGTDPSGAPVGLRTWLVRLDTGKLVEAVAGPLGADPEEYRAVLPDCDTGCRLVGFDLLGPELAGDGDEYAPPGAGTQVDLLRVGPAAAGSGVPLGDVSRWRTGLGAQELGPAIATGRGGLRLTMPDPLPDTVDTPWQSRVPLVAQPRVYVVDAPVPLPVVAAGWRRDPTEELRLAPLDAPAVPAEVARTGALLPVLTASGVLVDLEYATRLHPFPAAGGTAQVWLSESAPASIVDELEALGVSTVGEQTFDDALAALSSEGSAVGVRFQTVTALVALLLAAGAALAHSAQERGGRAGELAALRAQGMPARTVRRVGYAAVTALVLPAALVGLAAGLAGATVARILHPGFLDGWELLPAAPAGPYPVGLAAAATAVVLGAVVLTAAAALIRRTRRRPA